MSIPLIDIPREALCQEASIASITEYVACGKLAVAIVYHERDGRATTCASAVPDTI